MWWVISLGALGLISLVCLGCSVQRDPQALIEPTYSHQRDTEIASVRTGTQQIAEAKLATER